MENALIKFDTTKHDSGRVSTAGVLIVLLFIGRGGGWAEKISI